MLLQGKLQFFGQEKLEEVLRQVKQRLDIVSTVINILKVLRSELQRLPKIHTKSRIFEKLFLSEAQMQKEPLLICQLPLLLEKDIN